MSSSRISPYPSSRRARIAALGIAAAAATAAVAVSSGSGLSDDVTAALRELDSGGQPVAYRTVLAGLDEGRMLLAGGASPAVTQLVLRLETVLLVGAVAAVLFAGLYRFLSGRAAASAAAGAGLALAVPPAGHVLTPHWVAALAAVLAVGAACAPHRVWLGAALGGGAAVAAVAVTVAAVPLALLALLAIGLLNRRRALWTAVATVVLGAAWYALTRHVAPADWPGSPLRHGPRWQDLGDVIAATGGAAVLSPLVAVAPAAAAALVRDLPPGRRRWFGAAVAVVAAGLAVAPAYVPGASLGHHLAAVPVLAAAVWGAAYARCVPARVPLLAAAAVLTVTSLVLLRMPAPWRGRHLEPVLVAYALAALAAAAVVWVAAGRTTRRRTHEASWWAAGVVAMCAAQIPAALPGSPDTFRAEASAVAVAARQAPAAGHAIKTRQAIEPGTRP